MNPALLAAVAHRRRKLLLLGTGRAVDAGNSTFTNATFAPAADGVTTATLTYTARNAEDETVANAAVSFAVYRRFASASLSSVTVSPAEIDNDGELAYPVVTVLDTTGAAMVGIPAASVPVSSTGSNNTIAAVGSLTDVNGAISSSISSTTAEAKTLSATVGGLAITDTAALTVSGEGLTPALTEDFTTYTNTADMLADPRNIYSAEDVLTAQMTLVVDATAPGGQVMMYTFPDRTAEGDRCSDYTIGRNLTLPTPLTEAWVEVRAKFDTGFVTTVPGGWGCVSGNAYKFVFGRTQVSRFQVVLGVQGAGEVIETGYPGNEEPAAGKIPTGDLAFSEVVNAGYVTYWMHWKLGSGTGVCKLWVNGVNYINLTGLTTSASATSIYGIALGRNINHGPSAAQTMRWGSVKVYDADPGWTV